MNNLLEYKLIHDFMYPGLTLDKFDVEDNVYKCNWQELMIVVDTLYNKVFSLNKDWIQLSVDVK